MAQIDTYRNTLLKKKQELAKLNQDMAREQRKASDWSSDVCSSDLRKSSSFTEKNNFC